MPEEEYTIRISKDGRITIEGEGLTPQQIRDLAGYLIETVGPLRIERTDGGGAEGRVEIELDELVEAREEEETRERLRLKNEDA